MTSQSDQALPRPPARIIGFFYLIIIVAAAFAEPVVRDKLIVSGDAAATASNILGSEQLFRWAGAADFLTIVSDIIVAILLYYLLAPVSRSVALLAAAFRLTQTAIMAVDLLFHFGPLLLLKSAPHLTGFTTPQLQDLSLFALKLHSVGYNIGLLFFGVHCILIGYLIMKSTFLPRLIGILLAVAGLCYGINTMANLVLPSLPFKLFPYILLPGFFAELGLTLWLLIMGVNLPKWREQAARA